MSVLPPLHSPRPAPLPALLSLETSLLASEMSSPHCLVQQFCVLWPLGEIWHLSVDAVYSQDVEKCFTTLL